MTASFHPSSALPGDLIGRRLCETFGCYRWNYIKSQRPEPGQKPDWHTETTHPIDCRALWLHWQNPAVLIGVRFGQNTGYAVIDIDAPKEDGEGKKVNYLNPEAIAEMRAALETIGIVRTILVRSSHSNGVHLYIPLSEAVNTFNLAVCLEECLTAQGFQIAGGTLEIFPNPKPYGYGEAFTEFNAHSLPLQPGHGGCLLNDNLDPIGDSLEQFFELWDGAAEQQDMDQLRHATKVARETRRQKKRRRDRTTSRATDAWREDLEAMISEGWTDYGQTNYLLNKIACYGRVFLRLAGASLETYVEETAIQSPGYARYCRHQHHIHRRAKAWARAAEKFYWPLGDEPQRDAASDLPAIPSHNEQLAQDASRRIVQARTELEAENALPESITARREAIRARARVSPSTMGHDHNLPLWHPDHYQPDADSSEVSVLPDISRVSGENQMVSQTPNKSLKQRNINKVQTSEKTMKCIHAPVAGFREEVKEQTTNRGVRGDLLPSKPADKPVQAGADLNEQSTRLAPPSSLDELNSDEVSVEESIRRRNVHILYCCMKALGWNDCQLHAFLTERHVSDPFEQLSLDQQIALLSELQALSSGEQLPSPKPQAPPPSSSSEALPSSMPPADIEGKKRVDSQATSQPGTDGGQGSQNLPLPSSLTGAIASATTWTAFLKAVEQCFDHELKPIHCKYLQKLWPERFQDVRRMTEQIIAQRKTIRDLDRYLTTALQGLLDGTWSLAEPEASPSPKIGLSDEEKQWLQIAQTRRFVLEQTSANDKFAYPVCNPGTAYAIGSLMEVLPLEELVRSSEPIAAQDACALINEIHIEQGWPPLVIN